MRQKHQLKVVAGIESSAKRSTIRNLDTKAGLNPEELGSLYDIFHNVQYYHESQESNMDYASFETLMGKLTTWAKFLPRTDDQHERQDKVGRGFLMRLFNLFDRGGRGSLSFQASIHFDEQTVHALFSNLKILGHCDCSRQHTQRRP